MKFLNCFKKINPRVWKGIVFCEMLVVAVMIFMVPKEACASCAVELYPCPASIVVWSNVNIAWYKYGNGTLPNGHPYCGYYSLTQGDWFAGSFDRVLGQTVTFGRSVVSCVQRTNPAELQYFDCSMGSTAVLLNPLNQGAKCVNTGYYDPYYSASSAGTDSNYYIEADCPNSYSGGTWAAFSDGWQPALCTGGPSYPTCWISNQFSVAIVAEPPQTCVNLNFSMNPISTKILSMSPH